DHDVRGRALPCVPGAAQAQRQAHQQHPRGALEAAEVCGRLRADSEGTEGRDVQGRAAGDRRVGLRAVRSSPRGGEGEGDEWYAAACLAGEAGLRVGEVKALRWRE